jgi:DNA-binding XRE family transcriptional regulator
MTVITMTVWGESSGLDWHGYAERWYTHRPCPGAERKGKWAMLAEVIMPIGDRLKRLRTAAGLTQQALATKAELSMSAIIHIEKGRIPDPRGSTLKALAGALGVTVDELLSEVEGEAPPADQGGPKKPRRGRGKS